MRLISLLVLIASGCAEDGLREACIYTEGAFDIEEVSVLEDATGWPGYHDAIVLSYDTSALPPGGTWRVSSVDVLAMIPTSEFDSFPDGFPLDVEIFDGQSPDPNARYSVSQTLNKSALQWSQVTLQNPTEAWEVDQQRAWWSFDMTGVIPETGMQSQSYIVGIVWPNDFFSLVTVGYSNFNRPCDQNWTDYADGVGYVNNGAGGGGTDCNWPMMRVHVEVTDPDGNC